MEPASQRPPFWVLREGHVSPELLSKLDSGAGKGITPEAGPGAAQLLAAGASGDRQDRAKEGGLALGKQTEGGPYTQD